MEEMNGKISEKSVAIMEEMHASRHARRDLSNGRPGSAPARSSRTPEVPGARQKVARSHQSPHGLQRTESHGKVKAIEPRRQAKNFKNGPQKQAGEEPPQRREKKQPLIVKMPSPDTKVKAATSRERGRERGSRSQVKMTAKHDKEMAEVSRKAEERGERRRSTARRKVSLKDKGGGVGLIPEVVSDPAEYEIEALDPVDYEIEALNRLIETSRRALDAPPLVKPFAETEVGRALENLRQELYGTPSGANAAQKLSAPKSANAAVNTERSYTRRSTI